MLLKLTRLMDDNRTTPIKVNTDQIGFIEKPLAPDMGVGCILYMSWGVAYDVVEPHEQVDKMWNGT